MSAQNKPSLRSLGRRLLLVAGVLALVGSVTGSVGAASPAAVSTQGAYIPLAPSRILDTRINLGTSGGALANNAPRLLVVTNRFPSDSTTNVPANALGVVGNLTVTGATKAGYVALTPAPVPNPTTSTINFAAGQTIANGVSASLGSSGGQGVIYLTYSTVGSGHVGVIFDVTGYYAPVTGGTGAQGPKGDTGAAGTNGTNGSDGNTVLYGSGAPAAGLGIAGNFYIATNLNMIYGPKTTVWPSGTSLVGPQGASGSKGDTGATGSKGDTGAAGAKGDTGAAGSNGTNGADGNTVLYGSGAPADGLGVAGNFYIDTNTSTIYGPKTFSWPSGTSLVGPQGAAGAKGDTGAAGAKGDTGSKGAPGADGNTVLYGSGPPAPGLGTAGNFYIDTRTNMIYGPKTATWPDGTSLVGPQGAAGVKGDTGSKGDTGAAGAKGDTGATGSQGSQGPAGAKGDPGATGGQGPAGAAGATGATGPIGPNFITWSGASGSSGGLMISASTFTATHVYCAAQDGGYYNISFSIMRPNGGGSYGSIGNCVIPVGSETGSASLTPTALVPGSWLSMGGIGSSCPGGVCLPSGTPVSLMITP